MSTALSVRALAKRYGGLQALDDVSFDLDGGELLAVVGPNGAGKTTLLSIVAGSTEPSEGSFECAGGRVGWAPQRPAVYSRLSVRENLSCSPASSASTTPAPRPSGCSSRPPWPPRGRAPASPLGRQPPARQRRPRADRPARGAGPGRAHGGAGPGPARAAVGVHRGARRGRGGGAVLDPQRQRGESPRAPRAGPRRRSGALRRQPRRAAAGRRRAAGRRPRACAGALPASGPGESRGEGRPA